LLLRGGVNPLEEIPELAGTRGGVFYFHGDDAFRKEEAVRALADSHLDPATRDFNLDPLRGNEVDTEKLASVLATPPMMAEWRVVIVREVEGLASSSRSRDVLLAAVSSPPPGLALILSATVPQGSRAKFYKDLARRARSVEFQPFGDADLVGWLMARTSGRFGVDMEPEAAQALGAAIGADLGILAREIEKLVDFVGDRRRITLADVEAVGTRLPRQNRWRWFDLVGDGRIDEALGTLDVLFGDGETGVGLVIGLTTHLLRLGVVADRGPAELEAALPSHQRWLARKLVAQSKRWRADDIDAALEGLLRVDRLLKASPLTQEHLLEDWLLTLLARRAAA
jgi:DNA polymerase-3 subunit delta